MLEQITEPLALPLLDGSPDKVVEKNRHETLLARWYLMRESGERALVNIPSYDIPEEDKFKAHLLDTMIYRMIPRSKTVEAEPFTRHLVGRLQDSLKQIRGGK